MYVRNTVSYPVLPAERRIRAAVPTGARSHHDGSPDMSTAVLTSHFAPTGRQKPGHPRRPRLRLTPRGRAVITAVIILPAALAAVVVSSGAGSAVATGVSPSTSFEYVQVESGQSLWQVAAAIAPDADPRDVVSDIISLNGLPSSDVQPGQRLALPEAYTD